MLEERAHVATPGDGDAASGARSGASYRLITLGGLLLLNQDGQPQTSLGPRNLTLLAYLALATKPLTRDHVAELFWGDRDEDRARHSMREALSKLRQLLGADSIARRSDRVMLDPSVPLSVDARQLVAASSSGDARAVVALYGGPFLDGIHTGGARSLEDWCDAERSMYEARFTAACAIECARLRGESPRECAELARRWLQAAPLDPKAAIELLRALASPDTPDALRLATREYHSISERLANDFELAPHPSVAKVADAIAHRASAIVAMVPADDAVAEGDRRDVETNTRSPLRNDASPSDASAEQPRVARVRSWNGKRVAMVAMLVAASVAFITIGLLSMDRRPLSAGSDDGTLAIMPFEVLSGTGDRWLASGTPRLIGAALSRDHVVSVVSASRVHDALSPRDTTVAPSSTAALAAARSLGARWILTGSIIAGDGRYWLDMQLRDVRDRASSRRMTVSDSTLDAVIAQGTAQLATSVDAPAGGAQLVEFEPKTVTGYRAYIRAVQLRGQRRDDEAAAVLDAAIAADSGFVAAVMERRYMLDMPAAGARVDSARALDAAYVRSRSRATEFERLYFETYLAFHNGDHARAERDSRELVERYPSDPRAYNRALGVLEMHGRFSDATLLAERAIALDSTGNTSNTDECRVCIGYRALSEIAQVTGNLPRAEAMARHATLLGPDDPSAWGQLAAVLSAMGRHDDALAAGRRAGGIAPTDPEFAMMPIRLLLEAREYDAADSALRVWSSVTDRRFALHAADLRAMLLRERGQFQSAATLLATSLRRFPADSNWLLLVQGENLARVGDIGGTRRAFATALVTWPHERDSGRPGNYAGDRARSNTWPRAILADALWQLGSIDNASLTALADSIQATGAESYFARDWSLYHHVRGLIAMNEHRWPQAEREFAQSLWEHAGWPRSIVERANAQLAEGHAKDAVVTLRDAYASPLSAMSRYVPRSELDFHMARAFAAAGVMDSARVYARRASSAWKSADPSVRRRLAQLPAMN